MSYDLINIPIINNQSNIQTYTLPNIRCMHCNKPIAHLYNDYTILSTIERNQDVVFNMLRLDNYCCRMQLARAEIKTINKPDEDKILGSYQKIQFNPPTNSTSKLTPLNYAFSSNTTIRPNVKNRLVPIEYDMGESYNLTDEILVHKVHKTTYLAI